MKENVLCEKTLAFSVRIVNLHKFLTQKKEFVISKQLYKCGTSIGANVAEAQQAQSKPDFINKMNIALKEAYETVYWLRLIYATEYLQENAFESVMEDCEELVKLLTAIVKSARE